jgi:hypothetical protein
MKSPSEHLRLTDRIRRGWYVTKVDFLAQDVPGGYRKGLRRELRSDLTAAAGDVGMSKAVKDLGPASALAHQLKLAEGRKLPHWTTGAATMAVILYAWTGMALAMLNALTDAAEQLGGNRTVTAHSSWLGATVSVTRGDGLLSGGMTFSPLILVLLLIVVPLIAGRAWRYRPAWLQRRLASKPVST